MEFTIDGLGEDGRTVTVCEGDDVLTLGVTVERNTYEAQLTRKEALALAGSMSAMARALNRKEEE